MHILRPSRPGTSLRARLLAPIHDVIHLLAVSPRLLQASVAVFFIILTQGDALAQSTTGGSFSSSGLGSSMGVLSFIIMFFAYGMALVLVVSGGMAWKRGDDYWLHLFGAAVMAMAPSLVNYLFGANGLSNASLTASQINDAMNK